MEAATPLRQPNVRTLGEHLAIDGLVVDDEAAVRLVREREEAGDDPVKAVLDAIEIGARVLDREQAGANAEFVRAEFERAARGLAEGEDAREVRAPDLGARGGVAVTIKPEGFRAATHFFNDETDIDRLIDALGEIRKPERVT